jgi:putative transposase
MPAKDAVIKTAIEKVLPGCRKGRKKVIPLVQKDHPEIGAFRIRRVYVQSGFNLYQKPRSRKIQAVSNPLPICHKPNEEWAIDFMSDALENGRRIRIFNVIDHGTRFFIASKISSSIPARRVIEYLENAIEMYGKPERMRTDNGPEFRSKLFQLWLKNNAIKWEQIQPGKPQQNGCIERLNRTFREDVLDANIFPSIEKAQEIADSFRKEYNEERPHEAIKYLTPSKLMVA